MRLYFFFIFFLCCVFSCLVLYFVTLQAWKTLLWLGLHTSRWRLICIPIWMSSDPSLADSGWFMYGPHPSTLSLFLCRERGIPCSSLEWVTHLIGPSTARHFSNSASTVWTRARRWVKRLYSSHWMRSELHTALLLEQISLCSWVS